jgi:thiamine biosynthesis lipoprotein
MDTLVTITAYAPEGVDPAPAVGAAFRRMGEVEAVFSSYQESAALARLNAAGELEAPPAELSRVLQAALELSAAAEGHYSPSLGAVLELWGFGPTPPVTPRRPPEDAPLATALAAAQAGGVTVEDGRLGLRPGLRLDLGGYAKGYAVDEGVRVLREHGLSALVDAGGDMACTGPKPGGAPWRVGVRHPRDPDGLLGVVTLEGGAVATSGDYERYFEHEGQRFHHLLAPDTGRPARHHTQVTVRARSCAQADAWATALFVAEPERAQALARTARLQALWVPATPEAARVGDLVLEPPP